MRRAAVIVLATAALVGACGSGDGASGGAGASGTASGDGTPATTAARGVRLKRIGRFSSPVYLTAPPGDRRHLFVVEQEGRIRVLTGGRARRTPFLDIRSQVTAGGEQGLLSVAFAPDYARSGRFYVYFTDRSQDQRVVEYRRGSAERADAGSARLVLKMDDSEGNHNGGLLLFGPDRHLYIGTGDGGGAGDEHGARGNAQNLGSLLGKLLRIDPVEDGGRPYTVPSDNPFVGRSGRARRGLQLWPAQPLALLLRPLPPASLDRRRRPERGRGDRLVRRGKGRGANSAGARSRAARATRRGRARREEAGGHAILAGNIRDSHTGRRCLVDRPELFTQRPSTPALHTGDDFDTIRIRSTSHSTRHTPISWLCHSVRLKRGPWHDLVRKSTVRLPLIS